MMPSHDHLPADQHLHGRYCQCRCHECYSGLVGCLCLDCCCDPDDGLSEEENITRHSWLFEVSDDA